MSWLGVLLLREADGDRQWGECVTPQSWGSVDNLSTRGIVVDVGLPDTTHENRAEFSCTRSSTHGTSPIPNINIMSTNGHLGP